MPCVLQIKATSSALYLKGHIVTVKPVGSPIGRKEGLPDFIHVTLTNRDVADIEPYLVPWHVKYKHTVLENNTDNWRIQVRVDPIYVNASNTSRDIMKSSMTAFLDSKPETYNIAFTTSSITFNLLKTANIDELKKDFADVFDDILNINRYYLKSAAVNNVVNAGGFASVTFATFVNYIQDRLAE